MLSVPAESNSLGLASLQSTETLVLRQQLSLLSSSLLPPPLSSSSSSPSSTTATPTTPASPFLSPHLEMSPFSPAFLALCPLEVAWPLHSGFDPQMFGGVGGGGAALSSLSSLSSPSSSPSSVPFQWCHQAAFDLSQSCIDLSSSTSSSCSSSSASASSSSQSPFDLSKCPHDSELGLFLSQRMELVWHGEYDRLFRQYYPHTWYLIPTFYPPTDRWQIFKDSAKVRFSCAECGHGWTSMKGRVIFWFHLNYAANAGYVLFKLYGQQCQKCNNGKFEHAMWYPEEVVKVIGNVYNRVGQCYYGFVRPPLRIDRRQGKPRNQHNAELCQACKEGLCKEEWTVAAS